KGVRSTRETMALPRPEGLSLAIVEGVLTAWIVARPSRDCGRLPLPKGEGWGEGVQLIERNETPHPPPLPTPSRMFPPSAMSLSDRIGVNPGSVGERESRRAAVGVNAYQ